MLGRSDRVFLKSPIMTLFPQRHQGTMLIINSRQANA